MAKLSEIWAKVPKTKTTLYCILKHGSVAQSVEQRTENPCVGGSIPSRATQKRHDPFEGHVFLLCDFCGREIMGIFLQETVNYDTNNTEMLHFAKSLGNFLII